MLEFRHLTFYLLRSPILPLESTNAFLQLQKLNEQETYLRLLYSTCTMRHALFLSSPQLFKQVQKWLNGETPLSDKLIKTLYKYTVRSGTRSTPYGLFAGVSLGKISRSNHSHIERTKQNSVRYRLDMQYFSEMIQHVSQDRTIIPLLKYNINHTLIPQGNIYKYYHQQRRLNGSSKYYLRKVQSTPILDYILNQKIAELSYGNWIDLLIKTGAQSDQARHYIDKLIENGILESELSIQITSDDFYATFLASLESVDRNRKYLPVFEKIDNRLKSKDDLLKMHSDIEKLTKEVITEIDSKNLIQGDLLLGVKDNTIYENHINRIIKELKELLPLAIGQNNKELEQFKKQFRERYDCQMISILQALDPDTGIGYGKLPDYVQSNNIISDIGNVKSNRRRSNKDFEELILEKYTSSNNDKFNIKEVVLTEKDISILGKTPVPENMPTTFYAMGNLLYNENLNTNPFFCLHACGGTSAANLFTRFWDLDPELHAHIVEIAKFEQETTRNAIVAEVVHLPEARTGNILQRPPMRKAEISLMAKCNEGSTKINLNDLYLFISDNNLILWSKKLNCQIIPQLTSAHNFKIGMNIYRFLADLQNQNGHLNLRMNWGNLEKSSYLPRVRYKNIILSRARWKIPQITYRSPDNDKIQTVLENIERTYKLPQTVVISEGDNELLINLSNPLSRKILFEKLCKQDIILHEYIFSEFISPVKDDINTYANEIILPIAIDKNYNKNIVPPAITPDIKREFPLGSEWIYAKIYCGPNCTEYLLLEVIPQIVEILNERSLLKKWFFIRYNDVGHHIRLRMEVNQKEDFSCIVSTITNSLSNLLETRRIYNIQFDTYIREIERYTPENMELSEELFHWDSQHVISMIRKYPKITDRWLPGIQGISDYMTLAGLDNNQKLQFVETMRKTYSAEFGNNRENDKKLNLKYRKHKITIEESLSIRITGFTEKTNAIRTIFDPTSNKYDGNEQTPNKNQALLASYIHMFINRLFDINQRKYEYVLYHLLANYYRSVLERKKITQN